MILPGIAMPGPLIDIVKKGFVLELSQLAARLPFS
jgi:hypothetical protein